MTVQSILCQSQRGHSVIDRTVHILPNGGHHNMTWMRNLAHAAESIHSPTSILTLSSNAQLHQSLGAKSSSQRDEEKKMTTTEDTASHSAKGKKSSQEFSADIKQTAADDSVAKSPSLKRK